MNSLGSEIISKSINVLRKYPLCSRCLGRLFAKYGLGVSNVTRGNAIKTLALMELHRLVMSDIKNLTLLKDVSDNVGIMPQLVSKYSGVSTSKHKCYICSSRIEDIIVELLDKVISEFNKFKVNTFVVSIRKGSEIEKRELELISEFNLDSWESIRRELKRELGKKVKSLLGIEPDFKHPEALVSVDLDTLNVKVVTTPTYILCRYVKLGRKFPQSGWVSNNEAGKPPLTIEEVIKPITKPFNAEEFEIHSLGKEDHDVRVLGDGKPMILELRKVKDKSVSLNEVGKSVSPNEYIRVLFDKYVERKNLRTIKSRKSLKIYRLLILSKNPLKVDDVEKLMNEFSDRFVRQRTPTRILRRRKDMEVTKKVYDVKVRLIDDHILEMLIKCDGGLYVKELVHGDYGRTSPSFSEVLNSELIVLEVDLIHIFQT